MAGNRDIDAELREALARVERGQVVDLGSFAQYADATADLEHAAAADTPVPGDDELSRILRSYYRGLSSREEALESLWNLDPVVRFYRPAEHWLDG